jgi:hypothetical protein
MNVILSVSIITTAWRVFCLRMQQTASRYAVANVLNKQSRTADMGQSTSLGVDARIN